MVVEERGSGMSRAGVKGGIEVVARIVLKGVGWREIGIGVKRKVV